MSGHTALGLTLLVIGLGGIWVVKLAFKERRNVSSDRKLSDSKRSGLVRIK